MSDPIAKSFGYQLDELAMYLKDNLRWPSPDYGFALHVFSCLGEGPPFEAEVAALSSEDLQRLEEAPVLAAVGYAISLGQKWCDNNLKMKWCEGFDRLTSRDPFPSDRFSFFFRPAELLGVSLGAVACLDSCEKSVKWLRDILIKGEDYIDRRDIWPYMLGAYASSLLGHSWRPVIVPRIEELAVEDIAVLSWVCTVRELFDDMPDVKTRKDEYDKALLLRCGETVLNIKDPCRAAVVYVVLRSNVNKYVESRYERYWQINKSEKDAVALVTRICTRFHLLVRQLQHRYGKRDGFIIKDEYDVQDLLHAILKLHFDDVRPEEWTPSYAGNCSRVDFLLKEEGIVVETKMTRKTLDQRRVTNELIIDKERYRTHPDCNTLICFVYDPEGICSNPVALERDLSSSEDEPRVVVIVAPKG